MRISSVVFGNIRVHIAGGVALLIMAVCLYYGHTQALIDPPDLEPSLVDALQTGTFTGVYQNTSHGLQQLMESNWRRLHRPVWSVLADHVHNPEVEGKLTDHLYGLWAYYLSNTKQDRAFKDLWEASRRKGSYFTMVFRRPDTKKTQVTCEAEGTSGQLCVLGWMPHDSGVSLVDIANNRMYGTLHEYGPRGGAAHALRQYKGTSGQFPLIFIVESASGTEISETDSSSYAVIRQSAFKGFALRWFLWVAYAELVFIGIACFKLCRALCWLLTFGWLHPMYRQLRQAAAHNKPYVDQDSSIGPTPAAIIEQIETQLTTQPAGCYVCHNPGEHESGYITDSWAVGCMPGEIPCLYHLKHVLVELESIGQDEQQGATVTLKGWRFGWLFWERIRIMQFQLDYMPAQALQAELMRRKKYTEQRVVEAFENHLKQHGRAGRKDGSLDWEAELGAPPGSNQHYVGGCFKRLALEYHPDKPGSDFKLTPKQLTDKRTKILHAFEMAQKFFSSKE